MKLTWYWRGVDLIDVEVHKDRLTVGVFRPRPDEDDTPSGPSLRARAHLESSEIAIPMEPATVAFGFVGHSDG